MDTVSIGILIVCILLLLAAIVGLPFYMIWRSKDNAEKKKKAREQMHKDIDALQKKYSTTNNRERLNTKLQKVYYAGSPIPNTKNSKVPQPGSVTYSSAPLVVPKYEEAKTEREQERYAEGYILGVSLGSMLNTPADDTPTHIDTSNHNAFQFGGGETGGGGASGSWETSTPDTSSYDPPSYYDSTDSTSWSSSND